MCIKQRNGDKAGTCWYLIFYIKIQEKKEKALIDSLFKNESGF
jgi:hypothetical protein